MYGTSTKSIRHAFLFNILASKNVCQNYHFDLLWDPLKGSSFPRAANPAKTPAPRAQPNCGNPFQAEKWDPRHKILADPFVQLIRTKSANYSTFSKATRTIMLKGTKCCQTFWKTSRGPFDKFGDTCEISKKVPN